MELAVVPTALTFAHRLALYVAHDGTLVRLLPGLGVVPLWWLASAPRWSSRCVRLLSVRCLVYIDPRRGRLLACASYACSHEGTVVSGLEWVRLDEFLDSLRTLVSDQFF